LGLLFFGATIHIDFLCRGAYVIHAMKHNDPTKVSVFDWLAFPAMGGVPLSAISAIGIATRQSHDVAREPRHSRSIGEKDTATMRAIGFRAMLRAVFKRLLGQLA
jgi:hypothetical protein